MMGRMSDLWLETYEELNQSEIDYAEYLHTMEKLGFRDEEIKDHEESDVHHNSGSHYPIPEPETKTYFVAFERWTKKDPLDPEQLVAYDSGGNFNVVIELHCSYI